MRLERTRIIRLLVAVLVTSMVSTASISGERDMPASAPVGDTSIGGDFAVRATSVWGASTSEGTDFRLDGAARRATLSDVVFGDDFESGDLSAWASPYGMPSGAVAFFAATSCPAGWSPLVAAEARALVGTPSGGTHGGSLGSPLADLESREHYQSASDSSPTLWYSGHTHNWAYFSEWLDWASWNAQGQYIYFYQWTDGIDGDGSGYYPLAAGFNEHLYTDVQGGHSHDFPMSAAGWSVHAQLPYLQLLVCRKS
jgi:hypothetical protein